MKFVALIFIAGLIIGCGGGTTNAVGPTTKPKLDTVRYEASGYSAPTQTITISSTGEIRSVWRALNGQVEEHSGQLTASQITELAGLLANWEALASRYPHPPDGPEYKITCRSKTVEASNLDTPKAFEKVRLKISELAEAIKQ